MQPVDCNANGIQKGEKIIRDLTTIFYFIYNIVSGAKGAPQHINN